MRNDVYNHINFTAYIGGMRLSMEKYFYSICACGVICGLIKRLADDKYREIINFFTCVLVVTVILQPISRTKGISFDFVNGIENKSEETLSMIYSEELKNKLNILLEDNAYNAKVENIYCECKEHKLFKYFIVAYSIL